MNPYTYIYGLKDPRDGFIHYVGKSDKPNVRFSQHMLKKDKNIQKNLWLVGLEASKQKPELIILEKVTKIEWQIKEREWIAKGIKERWPLTNIQAGGGGNMPLETDWAETTRFYLSKSEFELFKILDNATQNVIGSAIVLKMMPYTKAQLHNEGREGDYIPGREAQIGADFATKLMKALGTRQFDELVNSVS